VPGTSETSIRGAVLCLEQIAKKLLTRVIHDGLIESKAETQLIGH
jgi:hypothetical protein